MRKAVVNPETGEVENVILARDGFIIPGKQLVDAEQAGPGWKYENGEFVEPVQEQPPEPEPSETEVRLAAIEAKLGVTREDLDAAKIVLKEQLKK